MSSGYKTEGYQGTGVGPIFVPAEATLNMSRADTLRTQLATEQDPEKRKALMMRIAIEEKYAQQAQGAQQQVQTSLVQNGLGPVMQGSPADPMAVARRKALMEEAERQRAAQMGTITPIRWDL